MGNVQTALELNYSSNINRFYGRERTEQRLKNMVGKSIKIWSVGVEPKRKERSFSTRLISQERVLSWRLTVLRETDLSGFSAQMLLEVFTESRISWGREGTNLPVHAYRSHSHFCLSFFPPPPSLFYFFVSLFKFLFLSRSSRRFFPPSLLTARPSFYSACCDQILLF